jgi:hypothetical protein
VEVDHAGFYVVDDAEFAVGVVGLIEDLKSIATGSLFVLASQARIPLAA